IESPALPARGCAGCSRSTLQQPFNFDTSSFQSREELRELLGRRVGFLLTLKGAFRKPNKSLVETLPFNHELSTFHPDKRGVRGMNEVCHNGNSFFFSLWGRY